MTGVLASPVCVTWEFSCLDWLKQSAEAVDGRHADQHRCCASLVGIGEALAVQQSRDHAVGAAGQSFAVLKECKQHWQST